MPAKNGGSAAAAATPAGPASALSLESLLQFIRRAPNRRPNGDLCDDSLLFESGRLREIWSKRCCDVDETRRPQLTSHLGYIRDEFRGLGGVSNCAEAYWMPAVRLKFFPGRLNLLVHFREGFTLGALYFFNDASKE